MKEFELGGLLPGVVGGTGQVGTSTAVCGQWAGSCTPTTTWNKVKMKIMVKK